MVYLQEVKGYLRKTDDTYDAELEALLGRAIDSVQRELDWYFGPPRAAEEILNGSGRQLMFLRQPPVGDTPLIAYDRAGPTEEWDVIDVLYYENDGRALLHSTVWSSGFRNYRFTYDEGFLTPPGEIVQLVLDLVAAKWGRETKAGIVSETLGRYSYTLKDVQETVNWGSVVKKWKRGRI